jgi:hypothetical protein
LVTPLTKPFALATCDSTPFLTAPNVSSAPFLIKSQSKVNTPLMTSPAPFATPISVLKFVIKTS